MFSEFQIKNQEVIFDLNNTIRIGIGTLKKSVFFLHRDWYWYLESMKVRNIGIVGLYVQANKKSP